MKKLFALIISIVIIFSSTNCFAVTSEEYAKQIESLKKQIEETNKKQSDLSGKSISAEEKKKQQEKLAEETEKQLNELSVLVDTLKSSIDNYQSLFNETESKLNKEIANLNAKEEEKQAAITTLNQLLVDIENLDEEMKKLQEEYVVKETEFIEISRVMYQNRNETSSLLTMFFNSNDIWDFINKRQAAKQISEEFKQKQQDMYDAKAELEEKKKIKEAVHDNTEVLIEQITEAIAILNGEIDETTLSFMELENLLDDLNDQISVASKNEDNLTKQLNKAQEEAEKAELEVLNNQKAYLDAIAKQQELKNKLQQAELAKAEQERIEAELKRAEEERKAQEEALKKAQEEAAKKAEELRKQQEEAEKKQSQVFLEGISFAWPLGITSTRFNDFFGYRTHPISKKWQLHSGVDINAGTGVKIYAAEAGVVEMAQTNGAFGLTVIINHGGTLKTLYAHCSKLLVKKGDTVKKGQNIALVGMTGGATGPHLHFEVQYKGSPIQPLSFLEPYKNNFSNWALAVQKASSNK